MRITLYQPDIPQNTGTLLRFAACLDLPVDIIEPCGFVWNTQKMKRAGMDYLDHVDITRHSSWDVFFETYKKTHRLVLMTTKTDLAYTDFEFGENDILIAGSESAGVPENVHNACHNRVTIPMHNEMRSLNIGMATAMITGEALRQINLK